MLRRPRSHSSPLLLRREILKGGTRQDSRPRHVCRQQGWLVEVQLSVPMRKPRAIIADDEPLLLQELRRLLEESWPELHVVAATSNGGQTLRAMQEHQPDVVFLDIRMPGLSGLEVAEAFEEMDEKTHLVFVTAYDHHAVQAFERGAVDYLLKPVTRDRLVATVGRLQKALENDQVRTAAPAVSASGVGMDSGSDPNSDTRLMVRAILRDLAKEEPSGLQWLRIGGRGEVRLVHVEDVICFRSEQKYTRVVTADGSDLVRLSLRSIEQQLSSSEFWRVHRGILINVRRLDSASRDARGRYVLRMRGLSEPLLTSSKYKHLFKQM